MIRIGVCDDNKILSENYASIVEECMKQKKLEYTLSTYYSGENLIESIERDVDIDILFLDVLMVKMNGIETAKKIRALKKRIQIIFLTSSEEYIFESVETKALAYLLKDQVNKISIEMMLNKALKKVDEDNKKIYFTKKDYQVSIRYDEISFLKRYPDGHYFIHHRDHIIFEMEDVPVIDDLLKHSFYQLNEAYIVNLKYVMKIEKDKIFFSNGETVNVSLRTSATKALKIALAELLTRNM